MIMSARYLRDTGEVTEVADHWVGRPQSENEAVYALFRSAGDGLLPERWYVYGISHDAIALQPKDLPEVVRLARMLIQ